MLSQCSLAGHRTWVHALTHHQTARIRRTHIQHLCDSLCAQASNLLLSHRASVPPPNSHSRGAREPPARQAQLQARPSHRVCHRVQTRLFDHALDQRVPVQPGARDNRARQWTVSWCPPASQRYSARHAHRAISASASVLPLLPPGASTSLLDEPRACTSLGRSPASRFADLGPSASPSWAR